MGDQARCSAEGCHELLGAVHRNTRYCSETCRNREAKRRYREKRRAETVFTIDKRRVKRGDAYETLRDNPELVAAIDEGRISQREAARAIGIGSTDFNRAWMTFHADRSMERRRENWEMDPDLAVQLAIGDHDAPCDCLCDGLDAWLEVAVDAFATFREQWFATPLGPYYTKAFHRTWIRKILTAIITGGRYLILSPPRHGKSELLVHFVVWLIARNPNIRIVWIGGNADIAGDMVGMVKLILEDREDLAEAILGPGGKWAPSGRNATPWGTTKLTVVNRSVISKAPTLRSVGRGGKILSMDVDLLICDDIEDYDSTLNESSREQTRSWVFNNVESRKEEHTGWVTIGSRQHPDDVYDYMLGDDEWESTVDSAHHHDCTRDPDAVSEHTDCMLFPELRTYRWLYSKRRSAESQGLLANFEMVYLNDPRPVGLTVFSAESIDASKNHDRVVGLSGLDPEAGWHLVAGLDPSATGFQAGFLWAWVKPENRLYAIDISNRKGGGVYPALELMVEWADVYGVKHWVIEENGFQKAIRENRDVTEWARRNDVYLEPHQTQGGNKHDPLYGVGAMSHLYESGMIDLPWGDETTREKFRSLERQMVRFTDNAALMRRQSRKSDILMASWFPMRVIRRFQKEVQAEASRAEGEFSFTGFDSSDWNEAPW